MRVALAGLDILVLDTQLARWTPKGRRKLAAAKANLYSPVGPLAVSPDGRFAWTGGEDKPWQQIDLATGTISALPFELVDAAFVAPEHIVAVVRNGTRNQVVEFSPARPSERNPVSVAKTRTLAWPYGSPYKFQGPSISEEDLDTLVRITHTAHGTVVAQSNGLVYVRWPDGEWVAWRTPKAYQGWIVGFAHAGGIVVTSMHNGRTGDVVWLDCNGNWTDCWQSNWSSLGPAVPCAGVFWMSCDETLFRFSGYPVVCDEVLKLSGSSVDATVDQDGTRAVVATDGAVVTITANAGIAVRGRDGSEEHHPLSADSAPHAASLTWIAVTDPDLGTIWRPDSARISALVALGERWVEDGGLPGQPPSSDATTEGSEAGVLRALCRNSPELRSLRSLRNVLVRIVDGRDADPFVRWLLQEVLPAGWRNLTPTHPIDPWIAARVPALHHGEARADTVTRATLGAVLPSRVRSSAGSIGARYGWCIQIELASGQTLLARIVEFWAAAMHCEPMPEDAPVDAREPLAELDGQEIELALVPLGCGLIAVTATKNGVEIVRTAAQFEPIQLDSPDDLRWLYYGSNADGLYLGRRDGAWVVDLTAEDLADARPTAMPAPLPAVRSMLDALVVDGALEMQGEIDDNLLYQAELAVFGHPEEETAARLLGEVLENHPNVGELFADDERLEAAVAFVRRGENS